MSKLILYKTGEVYFMDDGMGLGIHGGEIVREIDTTNATPQEIEELKSNPNNATLIEEIQKR